MSRRSMSFSWPRIWLERNCRSVRSDSRWGIEEFPGQGIRAGTADRGLYFTALAGALAWPWRRGGQGAPSLGAGMAGGFSLVAPEIPGARSYARSTFGIALNEYVAAAYVSPP
ncbi:hypothetical protein D3C76_1405730 [compost metagenome]